MPEAIPPTPSSPVLVWRVHLLQRQRTRLPVALLGVAFGSLCAGMIFQKPLPAFVAALLLLEALSEYLFPIVYRLDSRGAEARYGLRHSVILWKEAQRLTSRRNTALISPFALPSRFDGFRGTLLRFAQTGEAGDRESVLTFLAQVAPHLITTSAAEEPTGRENA